LCGLCSLGEVEHSETAGHPEVTVAVCQPIQCIAE